MSDDLIKRLRDRTFLTGSLEGLAANRIEELEGQCVVYAKWDKARVDYINDLEAKLAKAVEALRSTDSDANHGAMTSTYSEGTLRYLLRQIRDRARTVLAELEGGE
jgi:hypothetical protein